MKKPQPQQALGIVFFPAFDWAISPTHPERQERLLYTQDQIVEEGLFDIDGIAEYRPTLATHKDVERTHFCLPSAEHVCTPSHLASAGGALRAARTVMTGETRRAFALVRPPGHHAMRITHGNRGFCNINIEAIMLDHIRATFPHPERPLRIAVVDTDCHHGDGSQDIFWNDPDTLFISLHQDGRTLYPGTGFLHECGGPGARGKTVNIPLPPRTGDAGYLYAIEHAVLPILDAFQPDIIVNSAGQDNHFTDPLADMLLTAQGYARLTQALKPHIAVLEGGYSIRDALPYVNLALCLALADMPFDHVREPIQNMSYTKSFMAELEKAGTHVSDDVKRLCDAAREVFFHPPQQEAHPQRQATQDGDWWIEQRHIYYDTDMLTDRQQVATRLCEHCPGVSITHSHPSRGSKSTCVHLPRTRCEQCRRLADDISYSATRILYEV